MENEVFEEQIENIMTRIVELGESRRKDEALPSEEYMAWLELTIAANKIKFCHTAKRAGLEVSTNL